MKNLFRVLSGVLICSLTATTLNASVVNVYLDDTGVGAAGNQTATTVADPLGINGTVAAITGLNNSFTNRNTGMVPLPSNAISFTASFDYYIPDPTGLTSDDLLYAQVDLGGANSGSAGFVAGEPTQGWNTISVTGAINGEADIQLLAILADGGFGGTANYDTVNNPIAYYTDNFRIDVTLSKIPEPTATVVLAIVGSAGLVRRRR